MCIRDRLSIGLQSVDDGELKMLGRIHTYDEFLTTWKMVRKAGFHNVNIDLISAIPGQTKKSWETTLRTVAQLQPEHISAYSLIIEEGTVFGTIYGEDVYKRQAYGCLSDPAFRIVWNGSGAVLMEKSRWSPSCGCRHSSFSMEIKVINL